MVVMVGNVEDESRGAVYRPLSAGGWSWTAHHGYNSPHWLREGDAA